MQQKWRSIIRPKHLEVDESSLTECFGKFSAEPLERGFGITIGNSLRRIILSSLYGTAITSVKFDTVMHEFSVIPGVLEDVSIAAALAQRRISCVGVDVRPELA